jgi:exodeoxyribonuclease V alpha subunit
MPPSLRHYTSRAGDPHRHRHLQINARVRAGGWRGLLSVGVRESLEAINGIGHPAAMTDPGSRRALVAHGYTLDPESGEVRELAAHAGAFRRTGPQDRPARSARKIEQNIDACEAGWRRDHPGEEPAEAAAGVESAGPGG